MPGSGGAGPTVGRRRAAAGFQVAQALGQISWGKDCTPGLLPAGNRHDPRRCPRSSAGRGLGADFGQRCAAFVAGGWFAAEKQQAGAGAPSVEPQGSTTAAAIAPMKSAGGLRARRLWQGARRGGPGCRSGWPGGKIAATGLADKLQAFRPETAEIPRPRALRPRLGFACSGFPT